MVVMTESQPVEATNESTTVPTSLISQEVKLMVSE